MTVHDDYSISPALARASGLRVLDWEESSGRPLSAVSAKQLSAFGLRADEGDALHLADILTLSGAQLLDAQLAESTREGDLQGVIAGLRLPTRQPLRDGPALSVVQSEGKSAW